MFHKRKKSFFFELLKGLISGMAQNEGFTRRKISYISNNKHVVYFNPFKTDKTTANGNIRLCLKWKPQAKCR